MGRRGGCGVGGGGETKNGDKRHAAREREILGMKPDEQETAVR